MLDGDDRNAGRGQPREVTEQGAAVHEAFDAVAHEVGARALHQVDEGQLVLQREFLHAAPRWLLDVALGTLAMIVVCAGFAWLLALGTHLHAATLVLGTSPGGIAEMAITAKVLQLGVPVVTAFQVCRLVAVLVLVEPLYRRVRPRDAALPGD